MTKEDILKNGLLEQYVLGELNSIQSEYIEKLRVSDTETAELLDTIETNFENLALENTIAPPANVKVNLLTNISSNSDDSLSNNVSNTNSSRFWFGIAASFAAFFLLGSIWLYSELNTVKETLEVVTEQNQTLKQDLNSIEKNYDEASKWYAALSHPEAEQYILKGNTLSPDSKIVSFVNHKNKSVVINAEQLTALDDNHDYQMWADVDGEMIDMGVIPKNQKLVAMTYIEDAESLNITIEPVGGNDHPTVERLISNVYLD